MYQFLVPELVPIQHQLPFDPTHGYTFNELKKIGYPQATQAFKDFWQSTYQENSKLPLQIRLEDTGQFYKGLSVKKLSYASWGGFVTGAWVLEPIQQRIKAALVMGHGYGGRDNYSIAMIPRNTVIILPVARGFHLSAKPGYPGESSKHVIYRIHDKYEYSIRGCVAELWSAVSCAYEIYPYIKSCSFSGGSFGGGLGALMLPFEKRISRFHLCVPTFGHQPLRTKVPCTGSGESVRKYLSENPEVEQTTLPYFDSATAASLIKIPGIISPAIFDPAVPPLGQFSVANAIPGKKEVWVLQSGHFDTKVSAQEDRLLNEKLISFFEQGI